MSANQLFFFCISSLILIQDFFLNKFARPSNFHAKMNCDLCGFTFDLDFGSTFAIFNYTHHILIWSFFYCLSKSTFFFFKKKEQSDLSKKRRLSKIQLLTFDLKRSTYYFVKFQSFLWQQKPNSTFKFQQNSIASNLVNIQQKRKYFGTIFIYSKPFQGKFM